jgi:hypothetical protein
MNTFGFQMAVKNFLKRNTINFLNYALILRRSVQQKRYQNVNSIRLQLTTIYLLVLTLNALKGNLALFLTFV